VGRTPDIPIRVVVAAELRLYRETLAYLLGGDARLTVVGTAATVADVVACAHAVKPDVTIVDFRGAAGRAAVRVLAESTAATRVVAIAVRETDAEVVGLAEAGVGGYVTRDESLEDLVDVIVAAVNGELRCSPRIAAALLRRVAAVRDREAYGAPARLTRRETQIMQLVDEGLSNKEIALQLQIERATVKNHVHNILEKLHARSRVEAAARIRRQGLLSTPAARD
jgi:two-component system nitrate/nitrite response regulator NarL